MYEMFNKRYGKFLAKLANEIHWKIFLDIITPLKICSKGRPYLIIKPIIMINTIMGWFEIMKYNHKLSGNHLVDQVSLSNRNNASRIRMTRL